jgi:transmembrane sensor
MPERDFQRAFRSLDSAFQKAELSPEARERLEGALEARSHRARGRALLVPALALASGGLALALFLLLRAHPAPAPDYGGFALSSATPDLKIRADADGTVSVEAGQGTLEERDAAIAARVETAARLKRERGGIRVLRGRVELRVAKRRPQAPPAVILVSGGAIEVIGTRFRVEQEEVGGKVELFEGAIQFRVPDGRVLPLAPGESLRWPVAAPSPSLSPSGAPPVAEALQSPQPPAPPGPAAIPSRRQAHPPQVEAVLHRVVGLRARGDYAGAAGELSAALSRPLPESSRELLDYELGSLLTYQLADPRRACDHWRSFTVRYKSGRFAAEVRQAQETMKCPRRH